MICYHSLYLPLLYMVFLADFFQVWFHVFVPRIFLVWASFCNRLIFLQWLHITNPLWSPFGGFFAYRKKICVWRTCTTRKWKMLVSLMTIGNKNISLIGYMATHYTFVNKCITGSVFKSTDLAFVSIPSVVITIWFLTQTLVERSALLCLDIVLFYDSSMITCPACNLEFFSPLMIGNLCL